MKRRAKRWLIFIRCKQLVPADRLDADDRRDTPGGLYTFRSDYKLEHKARQDALDQFYDTVPISNLDHFDVSIDSVFGPRKATRALRRTDR